MKQVLLLICLALGSCATKSTVNEVLAPVMIKPLAYRNIIVKVDDNRVTDKGDINIPFVSWPGQERKHAKKLDKVKLAQELKESIPPGNQKYNDTLISVVKILKANQIFQATMFSEKEKIDVEIDVSNSVNGYPVCEATGFANAFVSSMDASVEISNYMLVMGIRRAYTEAMSKCTRFLDTRN